MLDGIIVVNKPKGCTSHDVVNIVKKILNEKVGHTGTLDPNATGVLPLLVGKGTKLSFYLIEHDKEYVVTLQLGIKTDTADCEGNVVEQKEVDETKLKDENVKNVLQSFLGKSKQMPPMYSAIKVNGKKLYEYARKDETVEIKSREIEIYEIELLNILKEEKQIVFRVKCSKGTYIRSLCEDIAQKLNTVGYMKELQRTIVGKFHIEDSITVEELEQNKDNIEFMQKHFITIEKFFESSLEESKIIQKQENENTNLKQKDKIHLKDIVLNEKRLKLFLNGVQLTYHLPDGLYRIYNEDKKFVGIGMVKNNLLKREIIVENEK